MALETTSGHLWPGAGHPVAGRRLANAGMVTNCAMSDMSGMPQRRFPPPWSVDEANSKLDRRCFIVRDTNGQALAYVYFEGELDRRSAAHLLTRDEAQRIAADVAKPGCLRRSC